VKLKSRAEPKFLLGYVENAELGTVTPGRLPASKYPRNTKLVREGDSMQVSCPCFNRVTQGACGGHHAELWIRLAAAETALRTADACVRALKHAMDSLADSEPALENLFSLLRPPSNETDRKPE
jgi:hypothetical protein